MGLLESTLRAIQPQDNAFRAQAKKRLDQLTMPHWAMGRLMDLAMDLAGMTRSVKPPVARKSIVVMAGDHGVCAEGVSKYPSEVTAQMVCNFVNGGAGINAMARLVGAQVVVVDMGVAADLSVLSNSNKIVGRKVAPGTANLARGPAMTRQQAVTALETGIQIANDLASTTDIFGTGEMGIGNTTPSTAIVACITATAVAEVTGRGTGIDDGSLKNKILVVERALLVNKPEPADGLDVLQKVGGFEIGGLAGLILGAAALHKPVVIDGFISTAAALIAHTLCPTSGEYMIAGHRSVEPGHRCMHNYLCKEPLLDLNMRLGEGTGAALAMNLVEASARILGEVATFEEAAVSGAK